MKNKLLNRRQMVLEVHHPNKSGVPKTALAAHLAAQYNVDAKNVFCFGFKLAFGGGRSTGFALIYDSLEAALDVEPKYRLIRAGLQKKVESSRKSRRELKNRKLKVRGIGKAKVGAKKK